MQSIREDIEKEHLEIQSTDVIMFFRVAEFVTTFQYHKCMASKVRFNWRMSDLDAVCIYSLWFSYNFI